MDYEHVAQKNVMVLALGMDSKEKGLKKHVLFFFSFETLLNFPF